MYKLPQKSVEHQHPSTMQVPIFLPAPSPPVEGEPKKVSVVALSGQNLKPLDFTYLGWTSSDPYVKIFFKNEMDATEVVEKTLNPKFHSEPFQLGHVSPGDTSLLEVQYWDFDKVTNDDFGGAAIVSMAGLLAKLKYSSGKLPRTT